MKNERSERYNNIWKRVMEIIKQQHETKESIADKAKISTVTLWHFLCGEKVRVSTLDKLENYLKKRK